MNKKELETALLLLGFEQYCSYYNYSTFRREGWFVRIWCEKVNVTSHLCKKGYRAISHEEALKQIASAL